MSRQTFPLWALYAVIMLAASALELCSMLGLVREVAKPLSNSLAAAALAVICILVSVLTAIAFHRWCSGPGKEAAAKRPGAR